MSVTLCNSAVVGDQRKVIEQDETGRRVILTNQISLTESGTTAFAAFHSSLLLRFPFASAAQRRHEELLAIKIYECQYFGDEIYCFSRSYANYMYVCVGKK